MFTWKRVAIVLSIAVSGIIAQPAVGQVRPAMVRSVDEPARVPYQIQAAPTCPFVNECFVTGTVVPAGKRLRVTRVLGTLLFQSTSIFAAIGLNSDLNPIVMFPESAINGAFFGSVVSFNETVDLYFEAGQTPFLTVGNAASISTDSRNRLTIVGYIVDVAP